MNNTTKRFPRSLREVGPWPENCFGIEKPIVCCSPWYVRLWRFLRNRLS